MSLATTASAAQVPPPYAVETIKDAIKSLPARRADDAAKLKPIGYPGDWITSEDYPPPAMREHQQGRTGFRLVVGVDGKPTACAVTMTSGSDLLDQTTCQLLIRRAAFAPAHDVAGKAIASTYISSVRWQIPEAPPVPIAPMDLTVGFDVDPSGTASHCMTSGSSQGLSPMAVPLAMLCTEMNGMKITLPQRNGTVPGVRHVTTRVIVSVSDPSPRIDTPSHRP